MCYLVWPSFVLTPSKSTRDPQRVITTATAATYSAAMAPKKAKSVLSGLKLDAKRYVPLLTKLMAESESLQNNPAQGLYPREDNCSQHVLEALAPYSKEGGPLTVERISFAEGRGNVIITYKGTGSGSIAFVGSHMDVVPANPETWKRDPFKLTVEGDHLYGRGATDCLGHVALLTELMMGLAIERPALQRTVTAVMIANEENGVVEGIGVDKLVQTGKLDHIKQGPVIWVDCADSQPCIGTAGSVTWFFKATGKLFHSGARREPSEPTILASPATSRPRTLDLDPRPAPRAPHRASRASAPARRSCLTRASTRSNWPTRRWPSCRTASTPSSSRCPRRRPGPL